MLCQPPLHKNGERVTAAVYYGLWGFAERRIKDWYHGDQYHVEQFKIADGKTLLDTQVQNLVQAMAAFSPPATGETTLPANYATSLSSVIAANWQ